MKEITLSFSECDDAMICIGKQGENMACRVRVDCRAQFDDLQVVSGVVKVKSANGEIYVAPTTMHDGFLEWPISGIDTAVSGLGQAQIELLGQNEEVLKTAIMQVGVSASLVVSGEPPRRVRDWLDEAFDMLQEVGTCVESANSAVESINELSVSAESTPADGQPTVEISEIEGHKHITFGVPKGDKGDTGVKGDKGDKGDTGAIASLTVGTVTTGAAGSNAVASVGGTAANPVLNFTIPCGEPGVKGDPGEPGQDAPSTPATPTQAGLMSAADKGKLDGIEAGAVLAPRPNLLDNWYFANPVNQRGQTEYTAAGYTIDRWYNHNAALKANVVSDGLKITATSSGDASMRYYNQRFERPEILLGRKVTISALMKGLTNMSDDKVSVSLYQADSVEYDEYDSIPVVDANSKVTVGGTILFTGTATVPATISKSGINIGIWIKDTASSGASLTIVAAKVELGDTQTLAHQDGGAWVLNETPDYSVELAKCQRYYQRIENSGMVCLGIVSPSKVAFCPYSLRVSMRETPSIIASGCTVYVGFGNNVTPSAVLFYSCSKDGDGSVQTVCLRANDVDRPSASTVVLSCSSGGSLEFVADL